MTDTNPAPQQAVRNLPVTIHAQYIKDVSFENPNAPHSLKVAAGRPDMQMNINVGLQEISDDDMPGLYEVSLRMRAAAKRGDKTAFIAEVEYAASVTVGKDVPEDALHPLLMIEVPRLLFPFARQMISDLSQQGGFPALMIAPVDFQALYVQKFSKELQAGESAKAAAS
ncbi:MAG: protein-export chaperone SecB [Micavibrio sp.]